MTHFAAVMPPLYSHLRAFEAIAWQLISRGHRVTILQQADVRPMLSLAQVGFDAIGAASHPPGSLAAVIRRAARPGGLFGLRRVIADMASATDMFCREAPARLRELKVDAVLVDQMEPGGALVAEHLGLPFVSIACALPFNREPQVPLPVMPWRYRTTAWGLQLDRHSSAVHDRLMRPHEEMIRHHCRAFGLEPRQGIGDCLSPLLQLSQTVAGFDFPRRELPRHFHAVGPLRLQANPDDALDLSFAAARPFVYASLGTLQGHRFSLFRRIALACRRLDMPLLISHCGGLTAQEVARLTRDGASLVTDFVPQREALAQAAVVITHAGLNTVLDALEVGTPMLALPIAFDQPGVAARIEHAGVGLRMNHRLASPGRIGNALKRLLREPAFGRRAARLGEEVRCAGGAERAAVLIEAAILGRMPEVAVAG